MLRYFVIGGKINPTLQTDRNISMCGKPKMARLSGKVPFDYKAFIAAQAKKEGIPEIYYVRGIIKERMDKVKRAKEKMVNK